MATYKARVFGAVDGADGTISGGTAYDGSQPATNGGDGGDVTVDFMFGTDSFATPNLMAINDILELCKVPKGARILDYYIDLPDMDSGTNFICDLGLGTANDDAFIDGGTVGQGAAILTPTNAPNGIVAGALPLTVTADDSFRLTCKTAPAGAGSATGVIKGWLRYSMRGQVF